MLDLQVFFNWIASNEDSNETLKVLVDWIGTTLFEVTKSISSTVRSINFHRQNEPISSVPLPLNTFPVGSEISAINVVFQNEANLFMCSGLTFYSDPNGINIIHQVQAGKESIHKLSPILFKQSNVWWKYNFNAEAIPPMSQHANSTNLPALIYGIPTEWSVCCWLTDSLASSFMLSPSSKINKLI